MSGSYPFIDIAALDEIRDGFVKGDAQLVLSTDLSEVLWANGPGAALFGYQKINDMIGQNFHLPIAARRQIETALSGEVPNIVSVRLASGLRSELTQLRISRIKLPDAAEGILLAAQQHNSPDAMIAGVYDDTSHIAILDASANLLAASPNFASLNISSSTLEDLIVEVGNAHNHIVKRHIRAGQDSIPGAITRLSDNPAKHMLCVAQESSTVNPVQATSDAVKRDEKTTDIEPDDQRAPLNNFLFDRYGPPARFIWKTNAEGIFTEVSPEFASIIGPNAADIIGRKFTEVAKVFGFDTDGSIGALLKKRDTWSGKRLLWPAEGTNLRVPVELAALPVYSRDRAFVGFRGFGLVNPSEAIEDPEALGLVLAGDLPPNRTVEETAPEVADASDNPLALSEEVANDDRAEKIASRQPIEFTPNPGRRADDRVIELLNVAAREKLLADQAKAKKAKQQTEPRPEGGLTPAERNAFREIAERLRKHGISNTSESDKDAIEKSAPAPEQTRNQALANLTESAVQNAATSADQANAPDEAALLSQLPIPVIIHSGDVIHYINQSFIDVTGYETVKDIQDAGGLEALFNSEPEDGKKCEGLLLHRADGTETVVDAHLNVISWRNQHAIMLSLMPVAKTDETAPSTDVENNLQLENQALETQVDELKTILDTATDGVVLIDPQGRIRSMNHSASALFGYEKEDTEGQFFSILFAVESQRAAMDYLHGLSDNGVMSVLNDGREVIGREVNGGFIPLFMTIGKLPNAGGFCAVLRDITQWKRTEEELTKARKEAERASTQKTEFLARISHEIRTPLNAIIGFSELMVDEKFGPIGNDRYRDYLRDINRSGNHVLALINDLLDISKIEAGGLDLQFEAVSLNDAIGEAIALMQPQANRDRVIIRSSFQPNLPDIVADARSIKQVALNLLSNAVRYTATGGQVIVSTNYELNGDVVIRVRDTGVGMSKEEIEQALKPFRQVNTLQRRPIDNPKDWRGEGTGLGLPLTKAMVEANRAQFSIDSIPGRGTVVEIIFPPTRVLAD